MKVQKMITLDYDLNESLKKVANASALINLLLRNHFGTLLTEDKACEHQWSNAFSTPGGLMRECNICHETKIVEVK